MTSSAHKEFLKRAMNYCALAERCTHDLVRKMSEWEVPEEEFESILERLKQEKFLDDDRYANSFVADKWKLDQWGRSKISNGLFHKGFGEQQIQRALDTIDQDEYVGIMESVLTRKRETIKKETPVQQMKKIISFGTSRGYEEELIWRWLEKEGLSFDAANTFEDEGEAF